MRSNYEYEYFDLNICTQLRRDGKEIILSIEFVLNDRCFTLTRPFSEESIFSMGGVMQSSAT